MLFITYAMESRKALLLDMRRKVATYLEQPGPLDRRLRSICRLLQENVPHYDWVGIYWVDPTNPTDLVLGPYSGAATEHTRIGFGVGICGQAAERQETFVVQDVSQETNYLSCSIETKSEIVVPILLGTAVLGEIDIDSHTIAPFLPEDSEFLEWLAAEIAGQNPVPLLG